MRRSWSLLSWSLCHKTWLLCVSFSLYLCDQVYRLDVEPKSCRIWILPLRAHHLRVMIPFWGRNSLPSSEWEELASDLRWGSLHCKSLSRYWWTSAFRVWRVCVPRLYWSRQVEFCFSWLHTHSHIGPTPPHENLSHSQARYLQSMLSLQWTHHYSYNLQGLCLAWILLEFTEKREIKLEKSWRRARQSRSLSSVDDPSKGA